MVHCEDPYAPILPGQKGTVDFIDDLSTIHVSWDNGRRLGVCLNVDEVEKISPMDGFVSFDATSAVDCSDEDDLEAHLGNVFAAVEKVEDLALDSGGAWVVRRSYADPGHEKRPVNYDFVRSGCLNDLIQGADTKNGVDAGFRKTGRDPSLILVAYGQNYASPQGDGVTTEVFECRLATKKAADDFEERIEAGWGERGEGPRKLFFSPRDHQPLAQAINDSRRLFRSTRRNTAMEL